jgi:hypothetical protein
LPQNEQSPGPTTNVVFIHDQRTLSHRRFDRELPCRWRRPSQRQDSAGGRTRDDRCCQRPACVAPELAGTGGRRVMSSSAFGIPEAGSRVKPESAKRLREARDADQIGDGCTRRAENRVAR